MGKRKEDYFYEKAHCHKHGVADFVLIETTWLCVDCLAKDDVPKEASPGHFMNEIFQKFLEYHPNALIKNVEYQKLEDGTITLLIQAKE